MYSSFQAEQHYGKAVFKKCKNFQNGYFLQKYLPSWDIVFMEMERAGIVQRRARHHALKPIVRQRRLTEKWKCQNEVCFPEHVKNASFKGKEELIFKSTVLSM